MWKMCIEYYDALLIAGLLAGTGMMLYILILGIIEYRKAIKEFEGFVRERQEMNRQLFKKNKL